MARPVAGSIVATPVFDDIQVADDVRLDVKLSVKVPVAVNCCVSPFVIDANRGNIEIETSSGSVTVSRAFAVCPETLAEIVVDPCVIDEARPAEIDATPGGKESQVADDVISCVVESVKVPVAVNDCGKPFGTDVFEGAISSEDNTAFVTVSRAEDDFPERFAVIVVDPGATDEARPVGSIVATEGVREAHRADDVIFCSLLSLYFPIAMNCRVRPFGIEGVGGVTDRETNTALVTVSEAVAVLPEWTAVIVVDPCFAPDTARPVTLIVDTSVSDEDQVAEKVTSDDVPFE